MVITIKISQYFSDGNTEVWKSSNNEGHYLSDKELNDIMDELTNGTPVVMDNYPLKNIRQNAIYA